MKNNKVMILGVVVLLAALAASVVLTSKNQETRRSAAFDTSTLKVLPAEKITAGVGETFAAQLWYYTSTNSKVDGVQTVVCYGSGVTLVSIVANAEAGFSADPITATKTLSTGACTTVVVTSNKEAAKLLTTGKAFTMYFKGIRTGTANISLDKNTSSMTGDNSASEVDKNITVTGVTGTSYEIVDTAGKANLRLSFMGDKYRVGGGVGANASVSLAEGKVSTIDVKINYDHSKLRLENIIPQNGFTIKTKEINNTTGAVQVSLESSTPVVASVSGIHFALMDFTAIGQGTVNLSYDPSYSIRVTGENTNNNVVTFETVTTPSDSITIQPAGLTPTQGVSGLVLKYKMTFWGITAGAQCADPAKMPLTVIVRAANGTTKTFTNIIATKLSGDQGGLGIYQVSLPLGDFNYKDNLAVFVKDGRHLQVKYGITEQSAFYNKAGGELSGLTNDEASTPVFDFTNYPLLAGDVTGTTSEVQDRVVDGLDFSYVKTQSIARTAADAGGYILADLNGNCKMESQDLSILMLSLSEKQGQLY
jgi:hypothetical protein